MAFSVLKFIAAFASNRIWPGPLPYLKDLVFQDFDVYPELGEQYWKNIQLKYMQLLNQNQDEIVFYVLKFVLMHYLIFLISLPTTCSQNIQNSIFKFISCEK